MWRAYIRFLETRPLLAESTSGTAVHHILWRSQYLKYVKNPWNLIRLRHADHAAAAALALVAEPNNKSLRTGFNATYKLAGTSKQWSPKNPKEVIYLYLEKRWSLKRIGKKYGVGPDAVRGYLQREYVLIRSNSESHLGIKVSTETRKKQSKAHMGNKYCLGFKHSKKTLEKMSENRRWKPYNSEELIRLYLEEELSIQQIAKKYNIGERTVSKFFRRRKIRIRTSGENQIGNTNWRGQ